VHHKSIIYNKPTTCNSGSTVFIKNFINDSMTNTSGCCYSL